MNTPTRKEAEELGRKFGDFAGTSDAGLLLFEMDAIGIVNMFDAWLDQHTPAQEAAKPKQVRAWRKRQIGGEA